MVWLLNIFFVQYFEVIGGMPALIIIGALLTLMNVIARPIIHILTAPLAFFAGILAFILSNAAFLWLTLEIANRFDPNVVSVYLHGWVGYVAAPIVLGIGNWIMKELVRL